MGRYKESPSVTYSRLLRAAAAKHEHSSRGRPPRALTVAEFRYQIRCPICGPSWALQLQSELRLEERGWCAEEVRDPAYRSLAESRSFRARLRLVRRQPDLRLSLPPWPELPPDDQPCWDDESARRHLIGVREPSPNWARR